MTDSRTICTFFYGSFINPDILKALELVPDQVEVAVLSGYDIRIAPLANLVPSDEHRVYGIAATATHAELDRLYNYATTTLGGTYLPEAVLVETRDGRWMPALCYIAPDLKPAAAANDYIDRIVEPGQKFGFPSWYIARLESFRPGR